MVFRRSPVLGDLVVQTLVRVAYRCASRDQTSPSAVWKFGVLFTPRTKKRACSWLVAENLAACKVLLKVESECPTF